MRLQLLLGLVKLQLNWCEIVEPEFAVVILRRAKFAPLTRELLDRDQQCALLRLLRPESGNALEPDSECHGTFHVKNLIGRKFLGLELAADYLLLLARLTLLRGDERHRVRLQLVSVFRAAPFRQQLRLLAS